MLVPLKIEDWSFDIIKELVISEYLETDTFEFKPSIKDFDPNNKLTHRILETTCAFANTNGGFIIFGIDDMGNKIGNRIIGIDKSDDLGKHFSDKIKKIYPTVYYKFRNPAIKIPKSNKILFVVQIFQSPERPHMKTDVGRFYIRTNGGNEFMTYQQIKEGFLRYDERYNKLNLLYMEISGNLAFAKEIVSTVKKNSISKLKDGEYLRYSTIKFETSVLASLISETLGIVDRDLIKMILKLRLQMISVNNELEHYLRYSIEDKKFQYDTHSKYVQQYIERSIIPLIENIITKLKKYGIEYKENEFKIFD